MSPFWIGSSLNLKSSAEFSILFANVVEYIFQFAYIRQVEHFQPSLYAWMHECEYNLIRSFGDEVQSYLGEYAPIAVGSLLVAKKHNKNWKHFPVGRHSTIGTKELPYLRIWSIVVLF